MKRRWATYESVKSPNDVACKMMLVVFTSVSLSFNSLWIFVIEQINIVPMKQMTMQSTNYAQFHTMTPGLFFLQQSICFS